MCSARFLLSICYVILVSGAVIAAPVAEKEEEKKRAAVAEVEDQDKDLQDLLSLVNKESHSDDVMVHEAQMSHFENDNGQSVKVEQKEEKVIDTKTGDVIADVKQEVKQEDAGTGDKPETVVATKVDIPAADVHETFVQEGQEASDAQASVDTEEPELTPADMAAYLYSTQQFDAFYSALDSLVNQSKMSAEDAEIYARTVALEYERLQLEDYEQHFLSEKRMAPQVPPMADDIYQLSGPVYPVEESITPFDLYGYPSGILSPEEQYLAQQQAELESYPGEIDPYEFLAALWDEAYGKGDREAQEIVRMLYERVSQDDNPDDMGQIRDLLIETVAASLGEDPLLYPEAAMESANQQAPVLEGVEPVAQQDKAAALEQLTEEEQKQEAVQQQAEKKEAEKKEADNAKSEAVAPNKSDNQKQ